MGLQRVEEDFLKEEANIPAVCLQGVTKGFGQREVPVLDGVDLEVAAGEFVAIMGPSGSGKSTLLNICAGLEWADDGTVEVCEQPLTAGSSRAAAELRLTSVGVVFQDDNLLQELTALENVMLPLRARRWSRGDSEDEAVEQMALLGVDALADKYPATMSGGEQQRVGIARALAGGKRLLIADEPTGALDSANTASVFTALCELADSGTAVLVASHDPVVRQYAHDVLEISDGRWIEGSTLC